MESNPTREAAENAAAVWLLRRESDRWSAADRGALERWLRASPSHRVAYIRLENLWRDTGRLRSLRPGFAPGQVPPRGAIEQSPFFTLRRGEPAGETGVAHAPRKSWTWKYGIAATVLAVLGLGVIAYTGGQSDFGSTYRTAVGGLSTVPTPDGSIVMLNTNSEIDVAFSPEERRIHLKRGEAFFEVAEDPLRPFAVYARGQRVVAVGTQFSVRLDPDAVRVAVTEGKVRLADDQLTAGAVAHIAERKIRVERRPLPAIEQALSWRAGYIVLDATPLVEAVAEFNRYNARQMVIADPALESISVGGNFRSTNLDGFLRLLERGFAVKAQDSGENRIRLSRK